MTKRYGTWKGHYGDDLDGLPYEDIFGGKYDSKSKPLAVVPRCYETHPELVLAGSRFIGGSCSHPKAGLIDVHIGLDYGMHPTPWRPWANEPQPVNVYYPITDMKAPVDPIDFRQLVEWACNQLQNGKTVHAGCIGGHGRTGLLITAMLAVFWDRGFGNEGAHEWLYDLPDQSMLIDRDFIGWTRAHYCKKAVETTEQMTFLQTHFGVKEQPPAKTKWLAPLPKTPRKIKASKLHVVEGVPVNRVASRGRVVNHVPSASSIWAKPELP